MDERDVPPLLKAAAHDTLDELHALLAAESADLRQVHAELFQQYLDELETLFLQYSEQPVGAPAALGPEAPPQRRWDGMAFRRERQQERLESFAALLDALRTVNVEDFETSLPDVADTGYSRTLWLLALGGLATAPLLTMTPDWTGAAAADGMGGLNWDARLAQWSAITFDKFRRQLARLAVTEASWEETEETLTGIMDAHTQHVTGLFDNEAYRAFSFGNAVAIDTAQSELRDSEDSAEVLDSVWLARTQSDGRLDPRVCLICRAKHMTVTPDRPVDDSHPGCRCIKVPVPRNFTPVAPLSFEGFLQGAS